MGAPCAGALFRMSAFRIRHQIPFQSQALAMHRRRNYLPILKLVRYTKRELQLAANVFQRRPARIFHRLRARTLIAVEVRSAMRAKSLAILATDRL